MTYLPQGGPTACVSDHSLILASTPHGGKRAAALPEFSVHSGFSFPSFLSFFLGKEGEQESGCCSSPFLVAPANLSVSLFGLNRLKWPNLNPSFGQGDVTGLPGPSLWQKAGIILVGL